MYLCPPEVLSVDHSSACTSEEIKANVEAQGIKLKIAPIESPGSIGRVKRCDAPLNSAFQRIHKDFGRSEHREHKQLLAVFAANSTVGPEGLCHILLVLGRFPDQRDAPRH